MKEQIANPLSVKEALELSENMRKSIIPITDYWENDINHEALNRLPLAVRMPKGLVTQAEDARMKNFLGEYLDIIPSSVANAAPYYADMIIDLSDFNKTHFPDGRVKSIFNKSIQQNIGGYPLE